MTRARLEIRDPDAINKKVICCYAGSMFVPALAVGLGVQYGLIVPTLAFSILPSIFISASLAAAVGFCACTMLYGYFLMRDAEITKERFWEGAAIEMLSGMLTGVTSGIMVAIMGSAGCSMIGAYAVAGLILGTCCSLVIALPFAIDFIAKTMKKENGWDSDDGFNPLLYKQFGSD